MKRSSALRKMARTHPHQGHQPSAWVEVPVKPRKWVPSLYKHYVPIGLELLEDEVFIPGESLQDVDDGEADDVPIRMLDDFAIFDSVTHEYVSVSCLLTEMSLKACTGVGYVRAVHEDSEDEQDDEEVEEPPLIQLSCIKDCSVHWVQRNGSSFALDEKVYLLTEHAWYILGSPSTAYVSHHKVFSTHHALYHSLISCLIETPDVSRDRLLDLLAQLNVDHSSISYDDLTSEPFVTYLTNVLRTWRNGIEHQQELLRWLTQSTLLECLYSSEIASVLAMETSEQATVVTPRVGAIAQRLFSQPLRIINLSNVRNVTCLPATDWPVHDGNPEVVEWGEGTPDPHIFISVALDGIVYTAGDVVMVDAGNDDHTTRAEHANSASAWCKNGLATKKWFCKINYFFEKHEKKCFHAQWLQHGSFTFLQEAAHSRALFWLDECEDLPVECIHTRCNLHPWPLGEAEPLQDLLGPENLFFTGLTLGDEHSFKSISVEEIEHALSHCAKYRPCVPCGLDAERASREQCQVLEGGGVALKGIDYHVNDFVYHHNTAGLLLHIGQIVEFFDGLSGEGLMVSVRRFGRYNHAMKNKAAALDERRLFMTDVIISVKMTEVEGKAYVARLSSPWQREQWVKADDHFYCDLFSQSMIAQSLDVLQPSALVHCEQCYAVALEEEAEEEILVKSSPKLRGLELFAGAGGLSTGLDLTGFVETRWAVELSESACKTFRANHQNAVVYNHDTCALLQHVVATAEGHCPPPLVDASGVELPPMPQRGEVDFIYGGPPCQSFSKMNHNKKIDDPRSTLCCNMISYVEFYRPMYFLLENVRGILDAPTCGLSQEPICMGVVKFILRSLTALGYQAHLKVLQAGQYGTPQGRERVIFIGSRCDVPLPKFPIPQHDYPKPIYCKRLPDGGVLYPHLRGTGCGQPCVPLPAVTISQAIGDLPSYDWENPHLVLPKSRKDKNKRSARLAQGIPSVDACGRGLAGFVTSVPYPHPPNSRFQSWVRQDHDMVTDHYSKRFKPTVIERVINVPLIAGANHSDLPEALQKTRWLNTDGSTKSEYRTVLGRLDNEGSFITALTNPNPEAKGGKLLHPTQHRIITIREAARAQGFPDSYQFLSIHDEPNDHYKDQARQIGNAVPVPLAAALGKEIGRSYIKFLKQKRNQEHPAQTAKSRSPEHV